MGVVEPLTPGRLSVSAERLVILNSVAPNRALSSHYQHFCGGQLRGGSQGLAPASTFSPLLPNTHESCPEQRLSNVVREFRFYMYQSGIAKNNAV